LGRRKRRERNGIRQRNFRNNQNFDVTHNARKNNAIKEEKNHSEQAKGDCSLVNEEKEEKYFSKLDSSNKDKGDINTNGGYFR